MDVKQAAFVGLFFILALASANMKFIPVWGAEGQFVSVIHFFAPIAGGFLGTLPGVAVVLAAEIVNFLLVGKAATTASIILLFPVLFGVWFFSNPTREKGIIVSVAGVILWLAHPVGLQAWVYAALFLIPLVAARFNNLAGRSVGAAYVAFVAGQILWLYFIPSTAAQWISWIPLVLMERTAFAVGIAASFVAFNSIVARVPQALPNGINIDKRYDIIAVVRRASRA